MAKLLKLRRGSTTSHASFTGAEGEVTIDTTKDTAVVHDGAQAGGRPLAREDMSNVSSTSIAGQLGTDSIAVGKIAGGTLPSDVKVTDSNVSGNLTIVNADVTASAAIAGTKISPDFGSQNIITSGTVDGKDISALGITGTTLDNGVTATTQAQSDNTTKVATTAYVKTAVANVVDSAPGALDTLNELAAALGDDANYATTTANSIATKLPKSGGQMTGNITFSGSQTVDGRDLSADGSKLDGIDSGAKDDQTKAEIDALNINADQVDGLHASSFIRSDAADSCTGDIKFNRGGVAVTVGANSDIRFTAGAWTGDTSAKIQHHANILYMNYPDAGSARFRDSAGNDNFTVDSSGNCTAAGNVTAYSDKRLKTDIHTINDALGICGKLRGVSYKWLKDNSAGIGVIAQEVEEVIPEIVLTKIDKDPATGTEVEVKSVDYGKIVGVLINAINELKAEVDELKGGK